MLFVTAGQVVNLDLIETSVGDVKPKVRKRADRSHAKGRTTKPKLDYSKTEAASKSEVAKNEVAKSEVAKSEVAKGKVPETKQQRTLWD